MSIMRRLLGNHIEEPPSELELESTDYDKNKRCRGKIFKILPKGYGFITSKEIPFTRIFFHWSALLPNTLNFAELKEGMQVEFTPITVHDKGTRAIRIAVVQKEG